MTPVFFRMVLAEQSYFVRNPVTGNDGIRGDWLGVDELHRSVWRSAGLFPLRDLDRMVRVTDAQLVLRLSRIR